MKERDEQEKMAQVFRGAGTLAEQNVTAWRQPAPSMLRHERQQNWDKSPRVIRGVEYFPIGALAAALGRKQVTIRSWEDKGWLPKARYRTPTPMVGKLPGKQPAGVRLYTKAQIEAVIEAAEATGVHIAGNGATADWKRFASMVRSAWAALK